MQSFIFSICSNNSKKMERKLLLSPRKFYFFSAFFNLFDIYKKKLPKRAVIQAPSSLVNVRERICFSDILKMYFYTKCSWNFSSTLFPFGMSIFTLVTSSYYYFQLGKHWSSRKNTLVDGAAAFMCAK